MPFFVEKTNNNPQTEGSTEDTFPCKKGRARQCGWWGHPEAPLHPSPRSMHRTTEAALAKVVMEVI